MVLIQNFLPSAWLDPSLLFCETCCRHLSTSLFYFFLCFTGVLHVRILNGGNGDVAMNTMWDKPIVCGCVRYGINEKLLIITVIIHFSTACVPNIFEELHKSLSVGHCLAIRMQSWACEKWWSMSGYLCQFRCKVMLACPLLLFDSPPHIFLWCILGWTVWQPYGHAGCCETE